MYLASTSSSQMVRCSVFSSRASKAPDPLRCWLKVSWWQEIRSWNQAGSPGSPSELRMEIRCFQLLKWLAPSLISSYQQLALWIPKWYVVFLFRWFAWKKSEVVSCCLDTRCLWTTSWQRYPNHSKVLNQSQWFQQNPGITHSLTCHGSPTLISTCMDWLHSGDIN